MKRWFPAVVLAAVVGAGFAGCGGVASRFANPSPAPSPRSCAPASAPFGSDGIWLSNADGGCSARLHPGDQVFVELHAVTGFDSWSELQSSDPSVLAEERIFWTAPEGVTPAHFRAAARGEVMLRSLAQSTCNSDLSACARHVRTWHITLLVVP